MTSFSTFSCTGTCPGFENNGVCNVPKLCYEGTDCADCTTFTQIWPILSIVFVVIFLTGAVYIIYKERQDARYVRPDGIENTTKT
eukprot:265077-Prymnesium_polylepis.1